MITSLLNRPYKKIVLDRFVKQEEEIICLVIEPKLVKAGIAEHYREQFRKRNMKLEEMSEVWKEIYRPQRHIREEWYKEVEEEIKKKEQEGIIKKLKTETASGISGICYILIK